MRIGALYSTEGRGHEVRCKALLDEMARRGWDTFVPAVADCTLDVLVLDGASVPNWCSFSAKTVRVMDDPRSVDFDSFALLVDGTATATAKEYSSRSPWSGQQVMAGPQYALLRPEFRAYAWDEHHTADGVRDLRELDGFSADHVARLMVDAGTVVTFGGMRALEAACVGTPMIVLPRNEGERRNAEGLARVAARCSSLEELSAAYRKLVDGRGVERVADAIEGLFK